MSFSSGLIFTDDLPVMLRSLFGLSNVYRSVSLRSYNGELKKIHNFGDPKVVQHKAIFKKDE